jgi:hypothetical protein
MRNPEVAGSNYGNARIPPPALRKLIPYQISTANPTMIPILDTTSYYNFLSGTMITLFVVILIIIFVYEYEVLRRPKNQS